MLGGDYLYGPYPRETVAIIRSLDAHVLRGNCEDLAEDWERSQLAPADLAWLQALPLTTTLDGVLYCHAAPTSNLPITTAITPEEAVLRTFAGVTRHGCDRPHAPSVRPQLRRAPGRQRRVGRDAVRGRGRGVLDARRGRRALVPPDPDRRRASRQRRPARARGRTRRNSQPRTCSSRNRVTRRSRSWRAGGREGEHRPCREAARPRRLVLRRARQPTTSAGGSRAPRFLAGGVEVVGRRARAAPGRPVISLDRRVERGTTLEVERVGAAADGRRRVLRLPADRARGRGGERALRSERWRTCFRVSRTTCSRSTAACCCRWSRTACAPSTSTRGASSSPRDSPTDARSTSSPSSRTRSRG